MAKIGFFMNKTINEWSTELYSGRGNTLHYNKMSVHSDALPMGI